MDSKDDRPDWGEFRSRGFAEHDIATPLGRMRCRVAGEGPPMLFVHGIGGGASGQAFARLAPSFTQSHRVIVPDLVGWGLSDHPAQMILFDDYVVMITALLDAFPSGAVVVAQSLAAGFCMAAAEQRPGRVARLILTNPTGLKDFGKSSFPLLAQVILKPLTGIAGLRLAFYRALFHRRGFMANWYRQQGFVDPGAVPEAVIDGALYSATRPNAAYSALPFVNGRLHYDIVPLLRRVAVPTHMILGGDPRFVGVANARRLAQIRADIATFTIEGAMACPELEKPEAVRQAIEALLAP
jgi:pimeloyl-ACP methyl ester carboxylesterase